MKIFVPYLAAACLAAGCIGCSSDAGTVAPQDPQSSGRASTEAGFPALEYPGTVYREQGEVYAADSAYQGGLISRYVIYDNGSFELQFISGKYGYFSFAGTYTKSGMVLTLHFPGSDTDLPWFATAVLSGDQMSVAYNQIGGLVRGGIYVRLPPT